MNELQRQQRAMTVGVPAVLAPLAAEEMAQVELIDDRIALPARMAPMVPAAPVLPAAPAEKKKRLNRTVVVGLCLLYIVCPIDLLPDIFPVVGWGDDLAAAVIGLRALLAR